MDIRQSDLSSYGRCAQQKKLYDLSRQGLVKRPSNLSRTVFGTVTHHALHVMERLYAEGRADALEVSQATFGYYWNPENLPEMAVDHPELIHGIDEWLPRDTYGGMRTRGLKALADYYELLTHDDGILLALEIQFRLPLPDLSHLGAPGQHYLSGTADRVAIRKYKNKPYLSIEDFKTGKTPTWLRYNAQFTAYAWASLQELFWQDFPDANERWQTYQSWARRGRWIDLRENKVKDTGWRAEADYGRLMIALAEYVKANERDVFPLSISGETCLYCPFRDGTCGGIALPDEDAGAPR